MKNYRLALIFGIIGMTFIFIHFLLIGVGFSVSAIVLGIGDYREGKKEENLIKSKVIAGELDNNALLEYDKTPRNMALTGFILGVVSLSLQVLILLFSIAALFAFPFFWNW